MRLWVIAASRKKRHSSHSFILLTAVLVAILATTCVAVALVTNKQVMVVAWDRQVRVNAPGKTVRDAIAQAGVVLGPSDWTSPDPDSPIKNGMRISVLRAEPAFVARGGEVTTLLTVENSVSAVLAEAGVEIGPDDIVVPGPGQEMPESGLVRVVKVTYENITADVKIPFATERREDGSIEAGLSKVYRYGTSGVSRVDYVARYEDGVEVSREELSRDEVTASKAQILLVGTLREVPRGGEDIRFERAIEVLSTAYCPCVKCCGPNAKGVTRLGLPATQGVIAVDPRVIPLGTRVYVDGYGYALAADTGSAIKGNRIDVCFATHEEALRWGMRNLKVYVIE